MDTFSKRGAGLVLAGILACLFACGLVWADTATNDDRNAVPITVDGFTGDGDTGGEYNSLQSLRYVSGSLYRGDNNDPRLNSRIYAVVAKDKSEPKNSPYALFVRFDFLRRTLPFADRETIGVIRFEMSTDGGLNRRPVTVTLRGAPTTAQCDGTLQFDDEPTPGTPIPIGLYGMKAAVGFAPGDLSSTTPYLHVELKAPSLLIPKNFGAPFPNRGYSDGYYLPALTHWTANFATDTANPLANPEDTQQSEAHIQIVPGATRADNNGLDIRAEVDVKPGNADNAIGSANSGVLVVAVISQPQLGADAINSVSVTIGDPLLSGVLRPSKAQLKDVNNDGIQDWVFNFDLTPDNNAINSASTVLELKGLTNTGAEFSGKDRVTVVR